MTNAIRASIATISAVAAWVILSSVSNAVALVRDLRQQRHMGQEYWRNL